MSNDIWNYKVTIVTNSAYEDVSNPEFRFSLDEKEKMLAFIDTCLENGHEVITVKTTIKYAPINTK